MNNKTGKTKQTDTSGIFRQISVNSIGENDIGKYYLLSVFGEDSNIPENTKVLTVGSQNKDVNFIAGILNKLNDDSLQDGEKKIFSTSPDGSEISAFIKLLNDGTMHFNGDADNIAGFTKLKSGFDTAITDLNNTITELNKIITALSTWVVVPNDGGASLKALVSGINNVADSSANIDDSKKDNLKIE